MTVSLDPENTVEPQTVLDEESLISDTPAALDQEVTHVQSPSINTQEVINNHKTPNRQEVQHNRSSSFFARRTINHVEKKTKRKFVTPYLSGSLAKQSNVDILEASKAKKNKLQNKPTQSKSVNKVKTVGKSKDHASIKVESNIE